MRTCTPAGETESVKLPWKPLVVRHGKPELRRSLWQLATTMVPYAALWYLMYRALSISYWLTLALSILAAGFLMRTFVIFHDCGHGSFFRSGTANHVTGFITGVLTLTPFHSWRHYHAVHHATSGNLDRRGSGDVWVLTVQEYLALPPKKRLWYRIYRHPLMMLGFGPLFVFVLTQRFPPSSGSRRDRLSVLWTNLALLALAAVLAWAMGLGAYLLIQLSVVWIGGVVGVWFFYVQHNYEGVCWERQGNWNFVSSALKSGSFYKLPRLFQWFTGSIGFHHVHHLSPRIPNYFLESCHYENPVFKDVPPLTFRASLKSLTLRLWDEEHRRLVGFDALQTPRA